MTDKPMSVLASRTAKRVTIALVLATVAAIAPQAAAAKGGSGRISTYGVGPLQLNKSGTAAARRFAGKPDRIYYENAVGLRTKPNRATWQTWSYGFAKGGYVDISFWHTGRAWVFEQFDTNLTRFATVRGTRVGMTFRQAQARERVSTMGGCIDSGFWHLRAGPVGRGYAYVVGVLPGRRVHALHALGPHPPVC